MNAYAPIVAKLDRAALRAHLERLLLPLVCLAAPIGDVFVVFTVGIVFDPLNVLRRAVLHNAEVVVEEILAAAQHSHCLTLLCRLELREGVSLVQEQTKLI